jgi:hypothetical protein
MFSRRICRPGGFAPNKKRKASEHELADRIDDARTVIGNLRCAEEHATNSAELIRRY